MNGGFRGRCDICGEPYDQLDSRPSMSEVAEFVAAPNLTDLLGKERIHVIAHAQCGLDAGMELA